MTKEYLQKIIDGEVIGDFYPFNSGDIDEVITYIKQIVEKLKSITTINVKPDFNYYGSGFAPYINIIISKKDGSDASTKQIDDTTAKRTKGIVLYISNLAPYWYYGASEWVLTTRKGKFVSEGWDFLKIENINDIDDELYGSEISRIKEILSEFRYVIPDESVLREQVDVDFEIETNTADKPYTVFDCLFYWYD